MLDLWKYLLAFFWELVNPISKRSVFQCLIQKRSSRRLLKIFYFNKQRLWIDQRLMALSGRHFWKASNQLIPWYKLTKISKTVLKYNDFDPLCHLERKIVLKTRQFQVVLTPNPRLLNVVVQRQRFCYNSTLFGLRKRSQLAGRVRDVGHGANYVYFVRVEASHHTSCVSG